MELIDYWNLIMPTVTIVLVTVFEEPAFGFMWLFYVCYMVIYITSAIKTKEVNK